jgi:hypothetical protein
MHFNYFELAKVTFVKIIKMHRSGYFGSLAAKYATKLPKYPRQSILIIFTKVTLASSNSALPDDGDYTEKFWSCFNVNFNVHFKTVFKTIQLYISW